MTSINHSTPLTLSELTFLIRETINFSLFENYWVIAEIGELKINQKGHCFIELIEKKEDRIVAQMRANIWAYDYRRLSLKFLKETGEFLREGIKTLFLVNVIFHEVYGLSLNIKDFETSYTIGELIKLKRQIIERLQKDGIMELNKTLNLPLVPQRIAIISSPTAAGYGDFIDHLENNLYGYEFNLKLFPAFMQGEEAGFTIIRALNQIKESHNQFDLVVIIRGGGSQIDLSCFDSYELASEIARFPLPVITGIGHEKDDTICDMVANTKVKTPTAAAELIISGVKSFEDRVLLCHRSLIRITENYLKEERYRLENMCKRFQHSIFQTIPEKMNRILVLSNRLKFLTDTFLRNSKQRLLNNKRILIIIIDNILKSSFDRLINLEQALKYLDPINVLKRGYSITSKMGKALVNTDSIKDGDLIVTRLFRGKIESVVQQIKKD